MSRLINDDCMKVLPTLADDSVEMVLTDIPYGNLEYFASRIVAPRTDGRVMLKGAADAVVFSLPELTAQLLRVCSGSLYVFCGMGQVSELGALFAQADLSVRLGIWEKTNPTPLHGERLWLSSIECCVFGRKASATFTERCSSSVWRETSHHGKIHPTQKPVSLFMRLIAASSKPGATILDPFMGSGTTGVACHTLGREFIGIEKDPAYFAAGSDRIRKVESQPLLA